MKLSELPRVWALTEDCKRLVRPDDPAARWTVNIAHWDNDAEAASGISRERLLEMVSARLRQEALFQGIYAVQAAPRLRAEARRTVRESAVTDASRREERERRKFMKAALETAEEEWEWIKAARGRF